MSIQTEYKKYCNNGGTLTQDQYGQLLDKMKTKIGELINCDPRDQRSDIGRKIFDYLDLSSGVQLTQVSSGLYERAKRRWFIGRVNDVVLKYVKQGANYKAYMKDGGWQDIACLGIGAAGAAFTVVAGVEASIHASRIPPDAPRKTETVTDEYGTHDVTIIDHPEAIKSGAWAAASAVTGTATVMGIAYRGINFLLSTVNLSTFFNATEEEILGSEKTNVVAKIISPDFHKWKLRKMKNNLTSNPRGWRQDKELSHFVCSISLDFMRFPVKDRCGHYFDYRSVVGHQQQNKTNPLECPLSRKKGNTGLARIQFDKAKFDTITRRIHEINQKPGV